MPGVVGGVLSIADLPAGTTTVELGVTLVSAFEVTDGSGGHGTIEVDVATSTGGPLVFELKPPAPPSWYDPQVGVWVERVCALFTYQGSPCGQLTKEIKVNVAGDPTTAAAARRVETPSESGPIAPLPDQALDLSIVITRVGGAASGLYKLALQSPHLASAVPAADVDLGDDSLRFATQLIRDVGQHVNDRTTDEVLRGIGRTISDHLPDEFWDALGTVWKAVAGADVPADQRRSPVVQLLTEEPHVPWELAVLPEPLDPEGPPFLGAQVDIGRWPLDRLAPPEPSPLATDALGVVVGHYQDARGVRPLPSAVAEAEALAGRFRARSVDALPEYVDAAPSRSLRRRRVRFRGPSLRRSRHQRPGPQRRLPDAVVGGSAVVVRLPRRRRHPLREGVPVPQRLSSGDRRRHPRVVRRGGRVRRQGRLPRVRGSAVVGVRRPGQGGVHRVLRGVESRGNGRGLPPLGPSPLRPDRCRLRQRHLAGLRLLRAPGAQAGRAQGRRRLAVSIEFTVDGGGAIDLGMGYTLAAGGFHGVGWALEPSDFDDSTRSAVGGDHVTPEMAAALERAGMREEQTISLSVVQETTDTTVRGPTYGEAMVLTAPDLGPGYGQVAIVTDEDGAVSIHFPVDDVDTQAPQPTATRGVGGEKVFVLRARVPPVAPDDGAPATRGLAGTIGRKLIQVVAFPVVEMAVRAGGSLVRGWEDDHRPHRLRHFGPADFSRALTDPWTGDDWRRLTGGPALVFVHGTFSTAHGAFGGLPQTVIDELHRRYEGRILAFDHPSLSMTPEENVGWLLDQLPGGATLEVDLVCHSRGGLVGRALSGELGDVDRSPVQVRRVVFVGTPNEGTALADPEHLTVLLDRMATVANLFPGVPVAEVLDAVLSVVKALAQGTLTGLEGLAAMRPGGDFLTRLSGGPDVEAEYFALASDFEPTRPGLKGLVQGAQDSFLDFVFRDEGNDLVVPTRGVWSGFAAGNAIAEGNRVEFDRGRGVTHCTYWPERETADQLLAWLPG